MDSDSASPASTGSLRVWIDAQLPPALASWLREAQQVDAHHVDALGLLEAGDQQIFAAARQAQIRIAVVTKDDDFVRMVRQQGPPPQVIWVRCGNVRNNELKRIILEAWPDTERYLAAGEPLLEIRARADI